MPLLLYFFYNFFSSLGMYMDILRASFGDENGRSYSFECLSDL